jgi:hypothetical protein
MILRKYLAGLALIAVVTMLTGCADCFNGKDAACPHPVPIVPPEDGPFNGGGNGM